MGPHRIYCGNAIEEDAYRVLMGEDRAAAVFTDPPYNVPIDGHASGLGAIHHREFAMASGEMDTGAFTQFLAQACGLLAGFSRDGSLHYLCMDWRHLRELLDAACKSYFVDGPAAADTAVAPAPRKSSKRRLEVH